MKEGSAVIIKNKQGQILLQHRDNNAPTDKNKWALWGGTKDENEEPVQTAVRELKEELSIDVLEDDLHFYNKFVLSYDDVNKKMVHVFELEDNGTFEYVLGEGDDLRFFTPEEITALELDFVAKPVLLSYFNK